MLQPPPQVLLQPLAQVASRSGTPAATLEQQLGMPSPRPSSVWGQKGTPRGGPASPGETEQQMAQASGLRKLAASGAKTIYWGLGPRPRASSPPGTRTEAPCTCSPPRAAQLCPCRGEQAALLTDLRPRNPARAVGGMRREWIPPTCGCCPSWTLSHSTWPQPGAPVDTAGLCLPELTS